MGFEDFFDMELLKSHQGFHVISMKEFLEKEAVTGGLKGMLPKGNRTGIWTLDTSPYHTDRSSDNNLSFLKIYGAESSGGTFTTWQISRLSGPGCTWPFQTDRETSTSARSTTRRSARIHYIYIYIYIYTDVRLWPYRLILGWHNSLG
jgi:hypothetical protein